MNVFDNLTISDQAKRAMTSQPFQDHDAAHPAHALDVITYPGGALNETAWTGGTLVRCRQCPFTLYYRDEID